MFVTSSQKFCAHCRCASLTFFFCAKGGGSPPVQHHVSHVSEGSTRVQELVSQLQAKLDAQSQDPDVPCVPTVKRFCRSGQGRVQVPLMPNSIPVELSTWLEERHAEMHDALMNGETARVLELSSRLSEGAERDGDHKWHVFVSFEATTVPATSNAVRAAHRICTDTESSTEVVEPIPVQNNGGVVNHRHQRRRLVVYQSRRSPPFQMSQTATTNGFSE